MPVDPEKLGKVVPFLIDHDRACRKCGYNLVGLMSDGVCPECGRKIQIRRRDVVRYSDNLVNAPLGWLSVLATGSVLLFVASLGVFFSLVIAAWLATRGVLLGCAISGGFGAIWYIGSWVVTRPRPKMKTILVDPHKEWAGLRWSARATQAFWVVSSLLLAIYAINDETFYAWCGLGAFVIAALGLIPFCALVSNIAHWGSDTGLAHHLRACAWSVGFSAVLITLHLLNIYTRSVLMGGFWASMIVALLMVFAVFPFFYLIFCCFQLQGMARWAMLNHATAEAKNARLRRRAEEAARQGPPPAPEGVAPVDLAAFNLADSEVDPDEGERARRRGGHVVQPKDHDETPLPVENEPLRRGRRV